MKIPTKKELKKKLEISFENDNLVTLNSDLLFDINGLNILVPKGFKTDGASNPFLKNKLNERVVAFGILHDYGYRTQFIKSRAFWDSMALVILPETADKMTAFLYYIALRLFGFLAWKQNQVKGLEKYPNVKNKLRKLLC